MSALPVSEHIAAIRWHGDLIADAVRRAPLDTAVPTCPGWTLRELVHHTGRTHLWAAAHVEQARSEPLSRDEEQELWGEPPADADVAAWYADTNARLVRALGAAPPDLACWTFLPAPSPLAFWARRQAHEASIHRADAQAAASTADGGSIDAVPVGFALDGIDELLCGFFSRPRNRLRSETPVTLAVVADTGLAGEPPSGWLVHIGLERGRAERGAGPSDCTVRGPASDLYLALWNRRRLTDLEVSGDAGVLELWAGTATVRWS